ncbi:hypothetical protein B0H21DRAFT_341253 [Amylocystis lapponica]|nr:hypothetical protein B0H21DRAFT_341253 [Amylocystis lapponica]
MTRIPAVAASPASASPAVAASPASAFPASAFPPLPPSDLPIVLADPHVLIIDIRPHNAHASARVPSALSLSVPSTLLKRPTYSLAKLAYMLPSVAARTRFATWPTASRIVVYDPDAPALVDRPALLGLLRKFRAEGFTRDLVWIRGGFHAVWRERPDLVDRAPLPEEEDDADDISTTGTETTKSVSAPATTLSFSRALRTKHLPMSAFTSASTQRVPPTPFASMPRGVPQSIPEGVVPPTPLAAIPDPFASVRVAPPVTRSVSVQPGSGSFALRLPPMARSTPPSVPGAQSMPTPSPQTYSIPGQYEAHHSAPPTKQVSYYADVVFFPVVP